MPVPLQTATPIPTFIESNNLSKKNGGLVHNDNETNRNRNLLSAVCAVIFNGLS